MRICVIFNPTAKGDKARRFREQLDRLEGPCHFKPTRGPGGGRTLAAEAVREGMEVVVAAGGDGTLNEVVNGIGDVPGGFERTALGVLPLGTVNVFARELRLPMRVAEAWRVILQGKVRMVDLLCAEFSRNGARERRYGVQLGGAGLDARAIDLVRWEDKKRWGALAYVAAGLRALQEAHPQITIDADGVRSAGELVLVGNGRLYGGWFVLFPRASLQDGVLDLCVFPRVNWRVVGSCAWGVLDRQIHRCGGAVHLRTESVRLSASAPVAFQLEGETVGELPAEVSVESKRLRVLVPGGGQVGEPQEEGVKNP